MEKTYESIGIRLINEFDVSDNSKEFIELLKDNYLINFPNIEDPSNFAVASFVDIKKFIEDGSALIIGAFLEKKVIGFLWAYRRVFLGETRLHISHIVVNSEFRGYGIGSRMIKYVEKLAIEKDIRTIELLTTSENENTIQFYNNHGFNMSRVKFEKNLGEKNDN